MWFLKCTLVSGNQSLVCYVGTVVSLYALHFYRCASVFAQAFLRLLHSEPHQTLPAKPSSLLMH